MMKKQFVKNGKRTSNLLSELKNRIEPISVFHLKILKKNHYRRKRVGMGKLLPAFRVSLTGLGMGPSLFDIAALLGKEETIKRMETALEKIN